jgi:hypothetical protein
MRCEFDCVAITQAVCLRMRSGLVRLGRSAAPAAARSCADRRSDGDKVRIVDALHQLVLVQPEVGVVAFAHRAPRVLVSAGVMPCGLGAVVHEHRLGLKYPIDAALQRFQRVEIVGADHDLRRVGLGVCPCEQRRQLPRKTRNELVGRGSAATWFDSREIRFRG